MEVLITPLAGLLVLKPRRDVDERGFFSETYNKTELAAEAGIADDFVQDNVSLSTHAGTLRGLHFQREPLAQAKLVSVTQGAAWDVAVDLRRSSETFGKYWSIMLSAAEGNQLYVPRGFAHGLLTLKPNTLVAYKVTNHYSAAHDAGIRYDDAILGIDWGRAPLVVSERDLAFPRFNPSSEYFP
jgi:dTDP-4-dehydrorhamnose 3,5-epimerase